MRVLLADGRKIPAAAWILQALGTFGLAWIVGITAAGNSFLTAVPILVTNILLIVSNGKYAPKAMLRL